MNNEFFIQELKEKRDITVLISSGVLLKLKGKGSRQMESYLLAQGRSWFDLMMDCLSANGVMKRLRNKAN